MYFKYLHVSYFTTLNCTHISHFALVSHVTVPCILVAILEVC